MKPSDFYNSKNWKYPYQGDPKDIYPLLDHLPEIDNYDTDYEKNERIECRVYYDPYIDGERCCTVGAAFFDDQPLMIYRDGGRGGRDAQDEFITDPVLYREMIIYLQSLSTRSIPDGGTFNSDVDIPGLDHFYNHKIIIEP